VRRQRPPLALGMRLSDFRSYYYWKAELAQFARQLSIPTHGYKPELSARIERRLRGLPDRRDSPPRGSSEPRDSDKRLRRSTRVKNYKSDARTRAFFLRQIGRHFHFTYHLNQYRIHHGDLTYGDLVDEWLAEYRRRKSPTYKASIASHGEYNRYVRDFFSDPANRGKTVREAARSWNAIKFGRGNRRYKPRSRTRR
jgi:SAP domain-containing protein/uncharacterized protein DUF6434